MNKPPVMSSKDFLRFLIAYGCVLVSSKGSHFKVCYPATNKVAPIPVHAGRDMKRSFMKDILVELGIDFDDFLGFIS